MKTKDTLSQHYAPLLYGQYDCIDRIVLNAYCPMLMVPGGVRNWYRLMEGIDMNQKRIKQVAVALLYLSMQPGGFTRKDLAEEMQGMNNPYYSCRNASYDLRKFRGKTMVQKVQGRIMYIVTRDGIKTIAAILCLLTQEAPAMVTVVKSQLAGIEKEQLLEVDQHLFAIRKEMKSIMQLHGLNKAA